MSDKALDEVLELVRVQGLATVQDLGLRGFMHEALPPGGALVPELLVAANRAVGNPDDACGIEVFGRASVRAVSGAATDVAVEKRVVAIDDGPARDLAPNDVVDIASGTHRCAYLAIRGGIRGIPFRGRFRGAFLAANIGAPLTAGTKLVSGTHYSETANMVPGTNYSASATLKLGTNFLASGPFVDVRIRPGPDLLQAFLPESVVTLTGAPFRILPASNRVGTRLAGAPLGRRADYRQRSYPMTIGAIEVPADGQPIVFGPEHPVTGGHPLIGVIATADLGRFHAIPLGGSVRFALAD